MNHTRHYQLPLFEASDKPSILTDWNETMNTLDVAIFTAAAGGSQEITQEIEALQNAVASIEARLTTDETSLGTVEGYVTTLKNEVEDPTTGLLARVTALEGQAGGSPAPSIIYSCFEILKEFAYKRLSVGLINQNVRLNLTGNLQSPSVMNGNFTIRMAGIEYASFNGNAVSSDLTITESDILPGVEESDRYYIFALDPYSQLVSNNSIDPTTECTPTLCPAENRMDYQKDLAALLLSKGTTFSSDYKKMSDNARTSWYPIQYDGYDSQTQKYAGYQLRLNVNTFMVCLPKNFSLTIKAPGNFDFAEEATVGRVNQNTQNLLLSNNFFYGNFVIVGEETLKNLGL